MSTATEHYDALETRDPAEREAALMAALPTQVRAAQATAALAERLAGIDAGSVTSRAALAALPVTRKHELLERQHAARERAAADPKRAYSDPFGGFAAIGWRGIGIARPARRVFQSPGPIYEPEGHAGDYWRMARAMFAAGIRGGHLLHNSFSYHLTPAGSITETGAQALGLHRVSGRRRQHRPAAAGAARTGRRRLCRHPQLPANPAGKKRPRTVCSYRG